MVLLELINEKERKIEGLRNQWLKENRRRKGRVCRKNDLFGLLLQIGRKKGERPLKKSLRTINNINYYDIF
jgi:hypothetical protein